jgi:hypothetical protein
MLQVKRHRVESVVKRYVETGGPLVEGRGGDHVSKKYGERRYSVIYLFITPSKFVKTALKLIIAEV